MTILYTAYKLNPPKDNPDWPPGTTNFSTQVNGLIDAAESIDTEVENAREEDSTLVDNLNNNYIPYILDQNIAGDLVENIRFTNMHASENAQDYVTKTEADIQANIPLVTSLDESVPPFYASDNYKVSSDGLSMDTFVNGYGNVTLTGTSSDSSVPRLNCSYLVDFTSFPRYNINLRTTPIVPVAGDELKFLLFGYYTTNNVKFYASTYKVMGNSYFVIDQGKYNSTTMTSYIHFIYVGGNTGWFLNNFIQRTT